MQKVQQHMVEGLPEVVSKLVEQDGKIGILSGLNTTAKDNLVNAVNELFTFANDGKTKWSSVIGSPLVSTDTFTQMQTKTQTIKNTLATNLTAKGQSSVGTETLTALVNKVGNIATGKEFAQGTVTMTSTGLVVSGLSFSPSVVVAINNSNGNIFYGKKSYNYYTGHINGYPSNTSSYVISSDGFSLQTSFGSPGHQVTWEAYA